MCEYWITGRQLMKRWKLPHIGKLYEIIMSGLPAYPFFNGERSKLAIDPFPCISEHDLAELHFFMSDVEIFEKKFRICLNEDNREIKTKNIYDNREIKYDNREIKKEASEEKLSSKGQQELGRLRLEKTKWDDSIKAAVVIGMVCGELESEGKTIKWKDLDEKISREGIKNLPDTTQRKIWKAIPEQYRKSAGRPKRENT